MRLQLPLTMAGVEREVENKFGDDDLSYVPDSLGFTGLGDRSPFGKGFKVRHTFADPRDFAKVLKQAQQLRRRLSFPSNFVSRWNRPGKAHPQLQYHLCTHIIPIQLAHQAR